MKNFIDQDLCKSGEQCRTCRDKEGGVKIRRGWLRFFVLPPASEGEPPENFVCPTERGSKPWGWTPEFVPEPRNKKTVKERIAAGATYVAHGAAGLAKSMLGVGIAPDAAVSARQAVCNECPKKTRVLGGLTTKCSECGCVLPSKQKLVSERCPLGKWDHITINPDSSVRVGLPVIQ